MKHNYMSTERRRGVGRVGRERGAVAALELAAQVAQAKEIASNWLCRS